MRLTVHSAELSEAEPGSKYFVVVSVGSQSLVTAHLRAPGTRERSRLPKAHEDDPGRGPTPSRASTTPFEAGDASAPASTLPSASASTSLPQRPKSVGNLSELTKLESPRGGRRVAVDLRFNSSARFILRRGGAVVARVAVYRAGRYRGTLKPELVAWCTIDLSRPFGEGPGEGASVADEAQSEVEGGSDLDEQEHARTARPLVAATVAARSSSGVADECEDDESTVDLLGLGETSKEPVGAGSDEAQAAADFELSLQGLGTSAQNGTEDAREAPGECELHATASDLAASFEHAGDEIFGAVYGGSSGGSDDQTEEERASKERDIRTFSPVDAVLSTVSAVPPAEVPASLPIASQQPFAARGRAAHRTSEEIAQAVEHPIVTLEGIERRIEHLPVELATSAKRHVAARVALPPRAAWHDARKMVASYRLVDPSDPLRIKGTLRVSAGASNTTGLDERMWRCLVGLADRDSDGRVGVQELSGLLEACGSDLPHDEREVFCEAVADEAAHRAASSACPTARAADGPPQGEEEDAFLRPEEDVDEVRSNGESSSGEDSSEDEEEEGVAEDDRDSGRLRGLDATARMAARVRASESGLEAAPRTSPGAAASPDATSHQAPAPSRPTATEGVPIRAASEALAALSRGDVLDRLLRRCPVDGSSIATWPRVARVLYVCLALSEASVSRGQHHMRGGYASAAHASRGWSSKAGEWLSQPLAGAPQALLLGNRNAAGGLRRGAAAAHILVYDRRSKVIVEERVPAIFSLAMRNMYQSTLGALLMREGYFSRLTRMSESKGRYMDSPESVHDIAPFVRTFKHEIDLTEVDEPADGFKTFNEFFSRKLLPGARPVAEPGDPFVISSAADCRLMAYATVQEAARFWIKGRAFSLAGLLGSSEEAALFLYGTVGGSEPARERREGGSVATTSCISLTESSPQMYDETDVQVSQASAATAPGALGSSYAQTQVRASASIPAAAPAAAPASAAAPAAARSTAASVDRTATDDGRSRAPSTTGRPETSTRGSALGRWVAEHRSPRPSPPSNAPQGAQPALAIFRLAPQDYHRYHSPISGTVVSICSIPGALYTVNPIAVNSHYADVFTQNKRDVLWLDSPVAGLVAVVAVGATMVGSIIWTVREGDILSRGDELGTFAFGGSTIILVLPGSARVRWDADLLANGTKSIETLVRANERIGTLDL